MNLINKLFKKEKKNIPSMVTTESNMVYSSRSNLSSGNKNHQEVSDGTISEEEYEIVEIEILPEKMICPDCGGITLVGLEFCDKCGGELTNLDV